MGTRRQGLLAVAALVCVAAYGVPARAQDAPPALGWIAQGQYVLVQGDRRKLLEDCDTRMVSGFLLEHLHLREPFASGLVLDVAAGLVIPERPSWSELYVEARFGRPGLWRIWTDVSRTMSFYDDSIGSAASAAGLYPSHELGRDLWKSRHDMLAGVALTPSTGTRLELLVDFSAAIGHVVPLHGSANVAPAAGYVFEYPSLWDVARRRGGAQLDLLWSRGGLGLSFTGAYRFLSVDDTLTAWRPLDGTAFDGTDLYERRRVIHTLSAGLGATLRLAPPVTLAGGYHLVYTFSNPGAARDAFGTVSRAEYGASGHSVFSHSVPLGLLVRPARGLDLRLRLLGAFSYGKTERDASALVGAPGMLVEQTQLASGVQSKKFVQGLELAWTGVRWVDVKLEQRFELDDRDLFRVLYDVYEADGVDTTTAEDIALKTTRLRVAAIAKFKIVKGLVLDARIRFAHVWQEDVIEYLRDWTPYGESRMWNLDAKLRLRYRLSSVLSLWAAGRFFTGVRWRPDVTDLDAGYDARITGLTVSGGVRAAPVGWLTLYASYSFTKGDHEVGPAPLMDAWRSIGYSGRIHAAQVGFGLVPLSWFELTGGYQMVLVDGTIEHRIHGMGAEARFRVWKDMHLGVGYLGRILEDGHLAQDGYSAHALRALFTGSF